LGEQNLGEQNRAGAGFTVEVGPSHTNRSASRTTRGVSGAELQGSGADHELGLERSLCAFDNPANGIGTEACPTESELTIR
jgi:hypothetical protein